MSFVDRFPPLAAVFLCLLSAACTPESDPVTDDYDAIDAPEFDDPDTMNELDALEEQLRAIEAEQDALDQAG